MRAAKRPAVASCRDGRTHTNTIIEEIKHEHCIRPLGEPAWSTDGAANGPRMRLQAHNMIKFPLKIVRWGLLTEIYFKYTVLTGTQP